jgi:hypothetical protein
MVDQPAANEPVRATPSLPSPTGFSNHAIHLVRTSQQINLTLSQMADAKASILMGATFLVFTISVGQARNGAMPLSLLVLAAFAFASALAAVFAVLPSISTPGKHNPAGDTPNKLFFGYFCVPTKPCSGRCSTISTRTGRCCSARSTGTSPMPTRSSWPGCA